MLVVGGGLSGLAAAARLGQAGVHVVVLEANARLGGALAGCPLGRYRMEVGPVWIDDRPLLDQGFQKLGADLDATVPLVEADPILRYEFGDGRRLLFHRDVEKTAGEIDALFPGEGAGYRSMMEHFPALADDAGGEEQSLDVFVREYLKEEDLRQALYSFGELQALEPQALPARELPVAKAHQHGVWVPVGGFRRLAASLAEVARAAGVQFVMGARVSELMVQDGAVSGVLLVGGLRLKARAVIATAPASTVYTDWMPAAVKSPEAPKILGMRLVAPPFLLQRNLEEPAAELPYLTVLGRADRALDQDAAVVHVVHQTALDASVAPQDRGLIRILGSLDYPAAGGSWGLRRKALGKAIAHRVENVLGPYLTTGEEVHRFHDPELLSALLRLSSRALYPALTRWQVGEGRVSQRSSAPEALYLAGSWTAGGPGVGGTVMGGIRAAELALEDLGVPGGE